MGTDITAINEIIGEIHEAIIEAEIDEIVTAMRKLGEEGFMVGDGVMLTDTLLTALNEDALDNIGFPHVPRMYVTDISDGLVTVTAEKNQFVFKFIEAEIHTYIVLLYRMGSGIKNADVYSRP